MDATLIWTVVGSLAAVVSVAVALAIGVLQLRQGQSAPGAPSPVSTVRDALRDVATRWYWHIGLRAFGAECDSSCVLTARDSSGLWEQILRTGEGSNPGRVDQGTASASSDPDSGSLIRSYSTSG